MPGRAWFRICLAVALLSASLLWLGQVDGQGVHLRWYVGQDWAPIAKVLKREAANYPQEPRRPEDGDRCLAEADQSPDLDGPRETALAGDGPDGRWRIQG